MQKIELSVHEFMSIMGALDEARGNEKQEENTIYDEWFSQWKTLDERLENLGMMERADMLFDGKISINAISESHFKQLINAVQTQVNMHKKLIETDDEDADPEDLEMWTNRLSQLTELHSSLDWIDQN